MSLTGKLTRVVEQHEIEEVSDGRLLGGAPLAAGGAALGEQLVELAAGLGLVLGARRAANQLLKTLIDRPMFPSKPLERALAVNEQIQAMRERIDLTELDEAPVKRRREIEDRAHRAEEDHEPEQHNPSEGRRFADGWRAGCDTARDRAD